MPNRGTITLIAMLIALLGLAFLQAAKVVRFAARVAAAIVLGIADHFTNRFSVQS